MKQLVALCDQSRQDSAIRDNLQKVSVSHHGRHTVPLQLHNGMNLFCFVQWKASVLHQRRHNVYILLLFCTQNMKFLCYTIGDLSITRLMSHWMAFLWQHDIHAFNAYLSIFCPLRVSIMPTWAETTQQQDRLYRTWTISNNVRPKTIS